MLAREQAHEFLNAPRKSGQAVHVGFERRTGDAAIAQQEGIATLDRVHGHSNPYRTRQSGLTNLRHRRRTGIGEQAGCGRGRGGATFGKSGDQTACDLIELALIVEGGAVANMGCAGDFTRLYRHWRAGPRDLDVVDEYGISGCCWAKGACWGKAYLTRHGLE